MPQQIIVASDGTLKVIETGPIGPPGMPGQPGTDGNAGNEIATVGVIVHHDIFELPEGATAEEWILLPSPQETYITTAIVGYGDEIDGIYAGGTPIGSSGDPEAWQPPIRLSELPSKAIFANIKAFTSFDVDLNGPFYLNKVGGIWIEPVQLGGGGSVSRVSGAYLLDMRLEPGLPYSPLWDMGGEGMPPDTVIIPPLYPPEVGGEGPPNYTFLGVDFSALPDDTDTFVLLIRNGQWHIVPTGWPDHSRGPWSLNIQFESLSPYNLVAMGTTMKEIYRWGFAPCAFDLTVDFHTGRGDS